MEQWPWDYAGWGRASALWPSEPCGLRTRTRQWRCARLLSDACAPAVPAGRTRLHFRGSQLPSIAHPQLPQEAGGPWGPKSQEIGPQEGGPEQGVPRPGLPLQMCTAARVSRAGWGSPARVLQRRLKPRSHGTEERSLDISVPLLISSSALRNPHPSLFSWLQINAAAIGVLIVAHDLC